MPMTITEKILAAHCGKKEVVPGELINAKLDLVLANDITAPISIKEFRKSGAKKVFDQDAHRAHPDHFTPNKDIAVRRAVQAPPAVREGARPVELLRGRQDGH